VEGTLGDGEEDCQVHSRPCLPSPAHQSIQGVPFGRMVRQIMNTMFVRATELARLPSPVKDLNDAENDAWEKTRVDAPGRADKKGDFFQHLLGSVAQLERQNGPSQKQGDEIGDNDRPRMQHQSIEEPETDSG